MYMGGGLGTGEMNPLYCLDLKTLQWRKIDCDAPLLSRQYASMCAYEGKLYIFGGSVNIKVMSDLICFDPETKTWTQSSDPHIEGRQGHQAIVTNGTMLIHGGQTFSSDLRADIIVYNFAVGSWEHPHDANSPPARFFHSLCSWNNNIYIWGGCGIQNGTFKCRSDMYALTDPKYVSILSFGADNGTNFMKRFPREIIFEILTLLSAEDLGRVGRVDRFFYQHRSNDRLWRNHVQNLVSKEIKLWDVKYDTFKLKNSENGFYFNAYLKLMQNNAPLISEMRKKHIFEKISSVNPPEVPKAQMVLLGNDGVGKLAFLQMFLFDEWPERYDPTLEDTHLYMIKWNSSDILDLKILDTSGAEVFMILRDQCKFFSS
eukprot:TRINITY_DN10003_c0_g1_i1.p1 TRINITY_DN10003_c0_g1~~TRINITY_DN10003_c0_g1_i1.p1  ORF type:complete len:373 (-),score=98.59 TRINITY_DN10003_c0_g1_i1:31-1149(-)